MMLGIAAAVLARKEFLRYQFVLLAAFLIALTVSGKLDYSIPIYVVAAISPSLVRCRRYSRYAIVFMAVSFFYLFYGLLFQSPIATVTTFVCRLCQFLAFFFALGGAYSRISYTSGRRLLLFALLVESALAVYLVFNGTVAYSSSFDGIRLVANSQPITGNIAITFLPLMGLLFFKEGPGSKNQAQLLGIGAAFLFWVVLSGTRGYILVFGACYAWMLLIYLFKGRSDRVRGETTLFLLCLFLVAVLILAAVYQDFLLEKISEVLRFGGGVGNRDQENAMVIDFYSNAPWYTKLIGIGIGGRWADYPAFVGAIAKCFSSTYLQGQYYGAVGTAVHNYFGNILILQGLAGSILVGGAFASMFGQSWRAANGNRAMVCFLFVYIISYAFMLYYRWSADCGISEMLMLAYVVRMLYADKEADMANLTIKEKG